MLQPRTLLLETSDKRQVKVQVDETLTFDELANRLRNTLALNITSAGLITYENARSQKVLLTSQADLDLLWAETASEVSVRMFFTSQLQASSSGPPTESLLSDSRRQPDIPRLRAAFEALVRNLQGDTQSILSSRSSNVAGDHRSAAERETERPDGIFTSLTSLIKLAEDAACVAAGGPPEVEERIQFEVKRGIEHFVHRLMRGHPGPPPPPPPPPPPLPPHHFAHSYGHPPPPPSHHHIHHSAPPHLMRYASSIFRQSGPGLYQDETERPMQRSRSQKSHRKHRGDDHLLPHLQSRSNTPSYMPGSFNAPSNTSTDRPAMAGPAPYASDPPNARLPSEAHSHSSTRNRSYSPPFVERLFATEDSSSSSDFDQDGHFGQPHHPHPHPHHIPPHHHPPPPLHPHHHQFHHAPKKPGKRGGGVHRP